MKTKKYRRSKYQFPTRVVKSGTKGTLVVGSKTAQNDIEKQLKRKLLPTAKLCHTKYEWCWREPQ